MNDVIVTFTLPSTIFLTGEMGSGKDFVGNILVEQAGYTRLAFADALKEEMCLHFGITLAELTARKAEFRSRMQDWGKAKREADVDYWVKEWAKRRAAIDGPVVCTDMRFPNEADHAMQNHYFAARIKTPENVRIGRLRSRDGSFNPSWLNHPTEVHIPHLPVACELDGTGSPEYYIPAIASVYRFLSFQMFQARELHSEEV